MSWGRGSAATAYLAVASCAKLEHGSSTEDGSSTGARLHDYIDATALGGSGGLVGPHDRFNMCHRLLGLITKEPTIAHKTRQRK